MFQYNSYNQTWERDIIDVYIQIYKCFDQIWKLQILGN